MMLATACKNEYHALGHPRKRRENTSRMFNLDHNKSSGFAVAVSRLDVPRVPEVRLIGAVHMVEEQDVSSPDAPRVLQARLIDARLMVEEQDVSSPDAPRVL